MAEWAPYVCMQTNSKCYKETIKFKPVGILWHSTGANNTSLKRYVQPTDGSANYDADIAKLGKNVNRNDWNHKQESKGVNAFIGKFADGTVGTVQCMPWDYAPWGCGIGFKGSCNKIRQSDGSYIGWIQFEICEDNLNDKDYAQKVYDEAVALTAYLCKEYKIKPDGVVTVKGVSIPTITCHNDASKLGFATSHSDINHWFPNILNKDMDAVRRDVGAALGEAPAALQGELHELPQTTENSTEELASYEVKITTNALNVRKGPGTNYNVNTVVHKNEIFTIIDEQDGWGKLKSKAGWIMLKYTSKV